MYEIPVSLTHPKLFSQDLLASPSTSNLLGSQGALHPPPLVPLHAPAPASAAQAVPAPPSLLLPPRPLGASAPDLHMGLGMDAELQLQLLQGAEMPLLPGGEMGVGLIDMKREEDVLSMLLQARTKEISFFCCSLTLLFFVRYI